MGHDIIHVLLDNQVYLLPTAIHSFAHDGTAFQWLWHVQHKGHFNIKDYKLGRARGSQVGKIMCTLSTTDTTLEGLLPKAYCIWAWSGNADRLFGPTGQLAPIIMESTIHS
eukprot:2341284-Ditylum_brightwellii.AAC.2